MTGPASGGFVQPIIATTPQAALARVDDYVAALLLALGGNALSIPDCLVLQTITGSVDGAAATVAGYYSAGDGGGGLFVWDANSTATVDNGIVFGLEPSGRWTRVYEGAVNVRWFGAVGDGVAEDRGSFISALAAGPEVFVPPGRYLIENVELPSNSTIFGAGPDSIVYLKTPIAEPSPGVMQQAFCVNSGWGAYGGIYGTMSTSDDGTSNAADNKHNITVRSLRFESQRLTFTQWCHFIRLTAASDVLIEQCEFVGFRGDGVIMGPMFGTERHTERVTITKCTFDGAGKVNRNGVSVIEGTDILIQDCHFRDCTKSDMPGAIDIEPDTLSAAYARLRNIKIENCSFEDIGGNVGCVAVAIPFPQSGMAFPADGITVQNCRFDTFRYSAFYAAQAQVADATTQPNNIRFIGNSITDATTGIGLLMDGVRGVLISGNTFRDLTGTALVLGQVRKCFDVRAEDDVYRRVGTATGRGYLLGALDTFSVRNCLFDAVGLADGSFGYAIALHTGFTGTSITLDGVEVVPGGRTLKAVDATGYTQTASGNAQRACKFASLNSDFVASGQQLFYNPTLGQFTGMLTGQAYLSAGLTVTGAELGDSVQVTCAAPLTAGLTLAAQVTATDEVKLVMFNGSGGTLTFPTPATSVQYFITVTKR